MEEASIAKSVKGCLVLFQTLTSLPSPPSSASDQAALIEITEEEPRFKVWSGNVGAHSSGRRSLQYRLRDASHLQKQVLALLADLSELLEDALAIIQGIKVPWDQIEDAEILPDEPDSLEGDSDGELPTTELEQIASNVPDTINCLLRLSVAIRNPAPHDRFAASIPIDASHYESFDIQHVQAKFPKIDSFLAQRLGQAISRRRHYFRYRETHHLKLSHGLDLNDQSDGKSTIASSIPGHAKGAGFDNALSTIDEDAASDSDISQTSFASSLADTERIRIPPLPKSAESGPFECPFCYMIIIASNRPSWKRHVFADLRPYVCLSEDCTAAEKWFARRHEWILHEIENHWKFYVCPCSCSESFQSRSKCVEHVQQSHPGATPAYQLEAVINLNSRPIRTKDGMICPICQERLDSVRKYQRHVGRHQEQLAIFALPSIQSQDNEHDLDDDESNLSQSDEGSMGIDTADDRVHLEELHVDNEDSTRENYSTEYDPDPVRTTTTLDDDKYQREEDEAQDRSTISSDSHGRRMVYENGVYRWERDLDDIFPYIKDGEMDRYNLNQRQQPNSLSGDESDQSHRNTSSSQRRPADVYIDKQRILDLNRDYGTSGRDSIVLVEGLPTSQNLSTALNSKILPPDPERERLEKELADFRVEQERASEAVKQRELEDKIRKDAEEALVRKIEEIRLQRKGS